jgi:RimJ/RimL family protein N-acetyltransferase
MEFKFESELVGSHVVLRKSQVEDAQFIFNLRTSHAGRFLRQPIDYSVNSQKKWMKSRPTNEINYIIHDKKTENKVGTISIYDVNKLDKIANVGRLILDEKYLKLSNPYGLESLLLTYNFVFNNLNFRKITGDILASNHEMFKFQIFLGMQEEGFLKEHVFIQNEFIGLHIMSLFKNDFLCKYQNKIMFLLRSFS